MKFQGYGVKPGLTKLCLSVAVISLIGCGGSSGGGKSSSSAALSSAAPSSVAATSASLATSSSSIQASSSLIQTSSSLMQISSSLMQISSSLMQTSSSSIEASSSSVGVSLSSIPASSSSAASSSGASLWKLVWQDEFEGSSIDTSKWGFETNCWGGGNNEQQCYTDRPVNSYVADGVLNIVAIKEQFTGSNSPDGAGAGTATLPYTSARLRTKDKQEWTFGRFEIRAKLPFGQGTWPAIWMLPTNSLYGTWASSGEIDIMEAVNLKTVTDGSAPEARVHGTLHYGRAWPDNKQSGAPYTLPNGVNPADGFHEYALEWEEGEIRWYVDGVHYATQRDTGWYSQYLQAGVLTDAPVGAPFDRNSEFHLLLNLAVGGNWAGNVNNKGIDESAFAQPQKMLVDYVRVYECSVSPVDGKGCATIGENAVVVAGNPRPAIGTVALPGPPLFVMYDDKLTSGLVFNSYNPDNLVSYSEVDEAGRGKVLNVVKTGANGNMYFQVNGRPTDLSIWSGDSELVFDVKVNSKAAGTNLLVKIDSGWPNVSDFTVPVGAEGEWKEVRITLADLRARGNSLAGGIANLASISNTFVIDSSGAINVSFDNIRITGSASGGTTVFAPLPLFTVYEDSLGAGLQTQTFTTGAGQIQTSELAEAGRGQVFRLAKTGGVGNAFFNIAGGANLSHWATTGRLAFDLKVVSKAAGVDLVVKMDSGWPNVSDATVTLPADGVWGSFSIDVADLIDNGNRYASGAASLNNISNIFVMEPTGTMEVYFDNIRLEVK